MAQKVTIEQVDFVVVQSEGLMLPDSNYRIDIKQLAELLSFDFIKIRTPYLYPDGDIVDIFLKYKDSVFLVTDLGEALRWLLTRSINSSLNKKKDKLIQNILINYHVERYKGMLIKRALNIENLSIAMLDLCQAIIKVSDIDETNHCHQ